MFSQRLARVSKSTDVLELSLSYVWPYFTRVSIFRVRVSVWVWVCASWVIWDGTARRGGEAVDGGRHGPAKGGVHGQRRAGGSRGGAAAGTILAALEQPLLEFFYVWHT